MLEKKQHQLHGNKLSLTVSKAPLFVRFVMFLFTLLFFLITLVGVLGLVTAEKIEIRSIILIIIFGVLSFYMLRISLWNTYGKEVIIFHKAKIEYLADYRWFKGGKIEIDINGQPEFGMQQIGDEKDKKGVLLIGLEKPNIICVTAIPNIELEEIIDKLNNLDNTSSY